MQTYKNICGYLRSWSKVDFTAGTYRYYKIRKPDNAEWLRRTKAILDVQDLTHHMMDGTCSMGLKTQEGRSHVPFSTIFHDGVEGTFFTPATYVADIVRACMELGMSESNTITEVGRALRALPSFIREMDLAYSVEQALRKLGNDVMAQSDSKTDRKGKCDVLLDVNGHEYRLWSYMDSPRGLQNLCHRLMGKRGELPAGRHLLCPFNDSRDIEVNQHYGWKLYRKLEVENFMNVIASGTEPIPYATLLRNMDELITKPTLFEVK